ncbi:MAG: indole-3-glycerol phosphate synthase TrpC [Rhodothermales bacterium]|nr:indole-3-glycerol phosphate synthase TrpC [Rhodothermales bacterium]
MSTILDDIIAATRARVRAARKKISVQDFSNFAAYHAETRSFSDALTSGPVNIIAELKRVSPSVGSIQTGAEPGEIASKYEAGGAAAISVLTEPEYFGGSLEDMEAVREHVTLPILRKDFIVDEYQIHEARARGADAILLIVRTLDKQQLAELHDVATSIGLDVLVELYEQEELDSVDTSHVRIVGANNRDLSTMTVDIGRSIQILEKLPSPIIKVSESGISNAQQMQVLVKNGIRAALIGESLMRHPDPGALLKELCGIEDDG